MIPFQTAVTSEPKRARVGPSIKMSVVKMAAGPSKVMFTFNELARALYFPDCQIGSMMNVQYGTGEDKGRVLIAKNDNGATPLAKFTKGAMSISVVAWPGLINAKYRSKDCEILTYNNNSVAVRNPHCDA